MCSTLIKAQVKLLTIYMCGFTFTCVCVGMCARKRGKEGVRERAVREGSLECVERLVSCETKQRCLLSKPHIASLKSLATLLAF